MNFMGKKRSIEEIKQKISDGSAVIMTAQELCQIAQTGNICNSAQSQGCNFGNVIVNAIVNHDSLYY